MSNIGLFFLIFSFFSGALCLRCWFFFIVFKILVFTFKAICTKSAMSIINEINATREIFAVVVTSSVTARRLLCLVV